MQLQHGKAAVLSDRDKGIARACRELNINERKCAVHIHANFHLAGYFMGPKQDTRGPFVEFVKAPNKERSEYLLLQLRTLHVHHEKWSAFKKAYEAVEQWVSVLSAIEQGHHSHIPLFKSHCLFLLLHHLYTDVLPLLPFSPSRTRCYAKSRRFGHPGEGH